MSQIIKKLFGDMFQQRLRIASAQMSGQGARKFAILVCLLHAAIWLVCAAFEVPHVSYGAWPITAIMVTPLFFWKSLQDFAENNIELIFQSFCFVSVCLFPPWMYLVNGASLWLGISAATCVAYIVMVDIRIAATGIGIGLTVACLSYFSMGPTTVFANELIELLATNIFSVILGAICLQLQTSRVNERMSSSNVMVGIMVHDLRTPLGTIELLAETLAKPNIKADPQEVARRLLMAVRTMNNTVDEQVLIAGLDAKNWEGKQFSLKETIIQAKNEYLDTVKQTPADINIDIEKDFVLKGAQSQFKRVLSSLIKNSHRAIVMANVPIGIIAIEVRGDNNTCNIAITDNGCGITDEVMSHLFRPYFTTAPGILRGLGLYYVKYIIEDMMQGSISVASKPNEPTTFTLILPLMPKEELYNSQNVSFLDSV